VTYENGPLAISGGLLNVDPPPQGTKYLYNGELLIKADTWGLSAVGSFAQLKMKYRGIEVEEASLFAYGVLNAVLGGPAFFFVTGLAAGIGYNRSFTLPTLNELPSFPLVAAATANPAQATKTIDRETIDRYVYPTIGQHWIAAGVRFTSFKRID